MNWAAQAMQPVDLGDERLNRRVVILLDKLGGNASASIPGPTTLWIGLQKLRAFVQAHQVYGTMPTQSYG